MNQAERWLAICEYIRIKNRICSRAELHAHLQDLSGTNTQSDNVRRYIDRDLKDLELRLVLASTDDGSGFTLSDHRLLTEEIGIYPLPEFEIYYASILKNKIKFNSSAANIIIFSQHRTLGICLEKLNTTFLFTRLGVGDKKKKIIDMMVDGKYDVIVILNDRTISSYKNLNLPGHCELTIAKTPLILDCQSTNGTTLHFPDSKAEYTKLFLKMKAEAICPPSTQKVSHESSLELTVKTINPGSAQKLPHQAIAALSSDTQIWLCL